MIAEEGKRWPYAAVLVLLVVALVLQANATRLLRSSDARFPELALVDKRLENSLRKAWPDDLPGEKYQKGRDAFAKLVRAGGADAARALFSILVSTHAHSTNGFDIYGPFYRDDSQEVFGTLLGELADDAVRRMMVRALPERDFHSAFRRTLAVALCRPGGDIQPLLERILDRQEDNAFRQRLLVRLPRLDVPAPRELRELLYQPFGYLDRYAAATLARMGDMEAPSLVLEGFRTARWDDGALYHLLLATQRFTGKTIPFSEDISVPGLGPDTSDAWHKARAARIKAVLAKWLDGRKLDTEFERGNRAYLASDQRRREVSLKTFDDILRAGNNFDLAAASLVVTGYDAESVRGLDRFARLLRPKLRGVTDPAEKIALLNRWIPKRDQSTEGMVHASGRLSFFPHVFSQDAGNCLGYSTLYLALAERLDLPLYGVFVPGHCFVRYDDGRVRRNIETTALGIQIPDEHYGASSLALGNRTKREMLSAILSNYAVTCRFYSNFDRALVACKRALQLDPANSAALANYATALYESGSNRRAELKATLQEMRQRVPEDARLPLFMADLHAGMGDTERALELAEEAFRVEDNAATRAAKARYLARLGRLDDARETLGVVGNDPGLRRAELEIRLREHPERAEKIVAEAIVSEPVRSDDDALVVLVEAASVLVAMNEARSALAVLDRGADAAAQSRTDAFLENIDGMMMDPMSWGMKRQRYYLVQAKALHALDRKSEAIAALSKAEDLGSAGRLTLEVRDLLR